MNYQVEEALIEERLRAAYDMTEAGDYDGALAELEKALIFCPTNIYIIALERQVKTLMEYLDAQELGEGRRMELIDPMPGLIQCAVREVKGSDHTPEPEMSPSAPGESEPEPDGVTTSEMSRSPEQNGYARREGAQEDLESVKLLYFQQAGAFFARGEYDRALIEVRRVFEVDPDNAIAREYVARLDHLLAQRRSGEPSPDQPEQEDPAPPFAVPDRPIEIMETMRVSFADSHVDHWGVIAPSNGRPNPVENRGASKRMPPVTSPHRIPSPRMREPVRKRTKVSRPVTHSRIERPVRGADDPRRFSTRMIVLTIIMGAIILAGGAYAAMLINRGSSTVVESRVRKTASLEDAAISAASVAATQEDSSTFPGQNDSLQTAGEDSPAVENPASDESGTSNPAASVRTATDGDAIPDRGKQEQIHHPVQRTPKKKESGISPGAPSRPVTSTPHLLAASMPESKPAGSGVPLNEKTPPAAPAYVPTLTEPQVVRLERPAIPDFLRMPGVVEKVVIKVLIDVDGKPIDTQILTSSKPALEKPVIRAVMNSKFLPGRSAIGPVRTWLTIPFRITTST